MNKDLKEKTTKIINHVLDIEFDNFIDFIGNKMDHWNDCFDHIYFIALFTHYTREQKTEEQIFILIANKILSYYDLRLEEEIEVYDSEYNFSGIFIDFTCNENEFFLKIRDQENEVHCIDFNPNHIKSE